MGPPWNKFTHHGPATQGVTNTSCDSLGSAGSFCTISMPENKSASVPPIDWTIEAVVSWLRGVWFDEDVCDKFELNVCHLAAHSTPPGLYLAVNRKKNWCNGAPCT